MKKLNILVLDTDDRGSQCGLPYHYRKLGHNVYMPKPNCNGIPWNRTAVWPRLLMRSMSQPMVRNVELHKFDKNVVKFGEDNFVFDELEDIVKQELYSSPAECDLVDLSDGKTKIDAFHTTSNAVAELRTLFSYVAKHAPNAKWISSSFNHWDHNPNNLNPKNVVRVLPANYDCAHKNVNSCNCYRHDTEFDIYAVSRKERLIASRVGVASFNHNYSVRQPEGHMLFTAMNALLESEGIQQVKNYGGNIRGQGADTRYSGVAGLTGKFETLSPRQAAKKYLSLRAIVHFKSTDWGGGVPAYARFAATPIITTQSFINTSHSNATLIDGYNCIVVNDSVEAAEAVKHIMNDDELVKKLSLGMECVHCSLFDNEGYWNDWERMLENLT